MRIPHTAKLHGDYEEFLADVGTSVAAFLRDAKPDDGAFGIYKICTAGHAVFGAWGKDFSLLRAAGGCSRRIAVLTGLRQYSLARVELRRLIECAVWFMYFVDHEVEWDEFVANPGRGWGGHDQDPIQAAAAADIGTFFRYAKAVLGKEASGLAKEAASGLHVQYGNLSATIHAAVGAVHPSGSLALAFDRHDSSVVQELVAAVKGVVGESLLVVAAAEPRVLARLDGIDRAWFDWCIGAERAKSVRGVPFGLSRSTSVRPF